MDDLRIGAYVRLSKEEGMLDTSNSIINQKIMINKYIDEHFQGAKCTFYTDDGYTGMNYNRPGFRHMLNKTVAGEIDVIIVKDLSRLGREYLETGRYIGRIFPSLNIRFISINDDYDSYKASISEKHLIMPIKSFINECYSRDISKKVRTNLNIMRKNGKYVGAYVAYGYKKSSKNFNEIVVDKDVAKYVREIYVKYLQGYTIKEIQNILDNNHVITPYRYKKIHNNKYYSGFVQDGDKWSYSTIRRILKDEIYIGNLLQAKRTTMNYKIRKCIENDETRVVRIHDNHEPIIEKELFYSVQRRLEVDHKKKDNNIYILSGLLRCGKCGNLMVRRTSLKGDIYICSEYNRCGKCIRNPIKEQLVEDIVLKIINCICKFKISENDISKNLKKMNDKENLPTSTNCSSEDNLRKLIYLCNINLKNIYVYKEEVDVNYEIYMKIGIMEYEL